MEVIRGHLGCPLSGGCPLFGGSAIGGSTVLIILYSTVGSKQLSLKGSCNCYRTNQSLGNSPPDLALHNLCGTISNTCHSVSLALTCHSAVAVYAFYN